MRNLLYFFVFFDCDVRRWLTRKNEREHQGFGRCRTSAVNEEEDNNNEDEEGNKIEEIRKGPQAKRRENLKKMRSRRMKC